MSPSVSVGVLGAAGTIAPAIVRDLAMSDEVERMVLLDLDGEQAAAVARRCGGEKATSIAVDARVQGALVRALGDVEVLVNAASYRVNLDVMRACLAAGCIRLSLAPPLTVRAHTKPWSGLGGSIVSTAAPAAAAVRLFARGSLDAVGALPPEQCIDPGELFAELESRGGTFSVLGPG